ncbi:MAG: exodeoxyribonuclease VII large subunit [Ruminococcaceae bacterium]|nr:exodeoxyribonuclease VII large subunit [Oscillospiraceae bacterium]
MNFGYTAPEQHDGALTVCELNRYVKMLMDNDALLSSVCVCGEISNLKYHTSGHLYFTLKDEEAEISAVMFRSAVQNMRFAAKNGMKVRAYGRVSTYEKSGKCQIYVSAMTDDGIGALQLEYERLRQKLASEGLFDEKKKRALPKVPSCIGIITSPTGAAVRDMINVTGRRWPSAKILIYPSLVQGAEAPESLCRAIEVLNAYNACDVIIIGRGGGSIEDLWAFNDERVVRTLAASEIPTISAVGHETDFTLCDFAADRRAPTPSAAAEIAVPDRNEYRVRADDAFDKLSNAMLRCVSERNIRFTQLQKRLELCSPTSRLATEKKMLSHKKEILDRLIGGIYIQQRDKLSAISASLTLINPLAILARGYSITKDGDGRIINSVDMIAENDELNITFADGDIGARVLSKRVKEETNNG